jgi:dienelactone hydrolase
LPWVPHSGLFESHTGLPLEERAISEGIDDRLKRALSDRYSIEREIERGGMAVVYLARDLRHCRNVAIKVLHPTLAATVAPERFLREIDVTAKLQHPNILTLIDSGEAEGLPYYVMPFVEGQSLRERLQREGPLSVGEAVRIASEAADALAHAHEKGVVHRDIKPGNILVSAGHAVVADFGIAAALDDAAIGRLTDTGLSLGSPAYMSPEQAMGEKTLDPRTDIYCLGCVLYEMLAGQPAFEGPVASMVTRKILGEVKPLKTLRPDVPAAIEQAITRAMATAPADRFASADAFMQALQVGLPHAGKGWSRRRGLAAAAVLIAVLASAVVMVRANQADAARALRAAQNLAEVEDLIDQGRHEDALALAEQVEAELPGDTTLARLLPTFTFTLPIRTEPAGARVYRQRMDVGADEWEDMGQTPLDGIRFAGGTFEPEGLGPTYIPDRPHRLRFELEGYQTRELLLSAVLGAGLGNIPPMDPVVLTREDPATAGMARIPGFTTPDSTRYQDFYMDRYEVTNREFKEFVDAGGYRNPEHWQHPFAMGGKALSHEEAMALLEDRTGRPGPSDWSLGDFPEGQADYPVGGVSWYEAAAYAHWRGKELPTSSHWAQAYVFSQDNSHAIVPRSNLSSNGPRAVGLNDAMTAYGVYDLLGNVREWCYNEAGPGARATRGGAWTDGEFLVGWVIPKDAFDRHETNGIRLVRTSDSEQATEKLRYPVERTVVRDFSTERPVSDAEYEIFKRLYDYDPVPLNPVVERSDTFPHWVRELVTYDLPYGERGGVILYLPRGVRGPVQPIVYWGGSGLLMLKSVEDEFLAGYDFLVKSGRAVALPLFAGSYGRIDPRPQSAWGSTVPGRSGTNAYRDVAIQWVKDLRTSIDYLETRDDVDSERVGFFGFSFGGRVGVVATAVEPRIDATILNTGGLGLNLYPPEVDVFNFASRVRTPVLMLNGQHDVVFPYEMSSRPLFELLGTASEDKSHVLFPASHFVPQDEMIKRSLDWFDKYLGVPAGG